MRILATADSHFGYFFGRTPQAKKESMNRMFEVFEVILNDAKKLNVDVILHGGDMFNRSNPKKKIVSKAFELLEVLAEEEISFIGIPGNHDRSKLPDTLLNFFHKSLFLLNKFSHVIMDNVIIIGFPFISREPSSALKKATELAKDNPSKSVILLCHQLFDGATFGPHQHVFSNRPDTLKTFNLPENILFTISGHIHRAQVLQNKRVFYTGSLERTSFMEIIEPKGFLLIDVEEDFFEVNFQRISSPQMVVKELDIKNESRLSNVIDQNYPEKKIRTLIRFIGRRLNQEELKFLWAYLPGKEFPYLSFSPKKTGNILRRLYSNSSTSFVFNGK